MISANIIADSQNQFGNRLTTFVLTFPRIVLAEFNTHRMLSRNSASSRAIPFKKMVKMVEENPFIPIAWQKDHSGMQGTDYFQHAEDVIYLINTWKEARDKAVASAKVLSETGVTKQLCNRLLEPFMWHTVIATGTEWENFFALRAHPAAEIHIAKLADLMLEAMNASTPKMLAPGEWHIPFGDNIALPSPIPIPAGLTLDQGVALRKVMIATARCARVSYLNFEGKDDYGADIALHDRLKDSGHWSPFEHCAKSMTLFEYEENRLHTAGNGKRSIQEGWSGNFRGFIQYRKMFQEENKSDYRLIKR